MPIARDSKNSKAESSRHRFALAVLRPITKQIAAMNIAPNSVSF